MLDLSKNILPKAVKVDGSFYQIKTSFKYWLRFSELLEDEETTPDMFDFIYKNEKPENKLNGLSELIKFYNPPSDIPRGTRASNLKVLDFKIDADYIYSSFLEQYGIDLIDETNLHWHKFLALLSGLHDTRLTKIIEYRSYENKGKRDEYVRQMEELRRTWELPQKETAEVKQAMKDFENWLET